MGITDLLEDNPNHDERGQFSSGDNVMHNGVMHTVKSVNGNKLTIKSHEPGNGENEIKTVDSSSVMKMHKLR
jgi:hypothetical protein